MKKVSAPKPKSNVVKDQPLFKDGTQPALSAKVGGVGNTAPNATTSYKKGKGG